MPLIAHTDLPTFKRLINEGESILTPNRAHTQAIRELHIGLLNMMPDAALEATERQFFRLIGHSNQIAQFFIHPITLTNITRGDKAQQHIDQYYQDFAQIKQHGLDALIVTGAHPELLNNKPALKELKMIVDWTFKHTASTLFSCFATHAVMQLCYGQNRTPLKEKCWGVFSHQVNDKTHPLVTNLNTRFDVPHSRFNEISQIQFIQANCIILVKSTIGVHLAVSNDGFKRVFFQGHPEYDTISLLKEYKRDMNEFLLGNRSDYPPFPHHYLNHQCKAILGEYQQQILNKTTNINAFPEKLLQNALDNTWRDSAMNMMNNWIGCVYQTTNKDLQQQFMDETDPDNPLNLIQT